MKRAVVTIHSAARRQAGYAAMLAANLAGHGHRADLFEAGWADLGDPSTFGDAHKFAEIRREFLRDAGVPRLAMRLMEPRGDDPTKSPGAAFDPILLYGFIADVRRQVQDRLVQQLLAARRSGYPSVTVAAHSMGTVVAFDLIESLPANNPRLPRIDLLLTLGSPLWMNVFDARHPKKLAAVASWLNIFHPADFIGRRLLPAFGDDGPCPPLDMPIDDAEGPGTPHSHYWASPLTAQALHHAWQGLAVQH